MSIWYICSSSLTLSLFSWMQFNVQKRMKCFNVITLMFSVSASININEMKLEMTSTVWKVKILWNWMIFLQFQNHIAPFQELCFLNNFGTIFLQFHSYIFPFPELYISSSNLYFSHSRIIFLQFQIYISPIPDYISPIPELYLSNSGIIFLRFLNYISPIPDLIFPIPELYVSNSGIIFVQFQNYISPIPEPKVSNWKQALQ